MKRYFIVAVLVLVVLGMWQVQAQRNVNVLLQAFGQSPMPVWRPIIRVPAVVAVLKDGQLSLFYTERLRLASDIAYATGQAVTWHAWVKDPSSPTGSVAVLRDDYLTEANAALAAIEAHIALLES